MAKDNHDELRALANLSAATARLALESTAAQLAAGSHRDPAGAARNAAVVYGISIDKMHALEDRPPTPTIHEDPKNGAQRLARKLGLVLTDDGWKRPGELPLTAATQAESAGSNAPARED